MQNLASLRTAQERHEDAESLLRELLEARRRALAPDHPDTLAAMNALAASLVMLDRSDESLLHVDDALIAARRKLPETTAHVGHLLHTRGRALTRLGRHEEAEIALLEAHRTLTGVLGSKHPRVSRWAEGLAELYDAWGKPDEAAMWRASLPARPDAPDPAGAGRGGSAK